MTKKILKHFLFFLCAILSFQVSFSQVLSKYAVGINIGTFIYQGDLTPSKTGAFNTPGFVFGLDGSRRISNVLSARLELNFGRLKADETTYETPAYRQQRAFAFKSKVTEVITSAVYHPLGKERKFSPYVFGGAGLSFLHIQRDYSLFQASYFENEPGLQEGLAKDLAQSLPKTILVLPVGVGLRYLISEKIALYGEGSYRIMNTDYLDGFSQAANPSLKDHYYKYSVGIEFLLGGKSKFDCPSVK